MPKYADGNAVMLGDRVRLGADAEGTVVLVVEDRQVAADWPEPDWSFLGKGIMAVFPKYGPIHWEEPEDEPDLVLVARGEEMA